MRNISEKVDGVDTLPASDFNANLRLELQNAVESADLTLDPEGGPDTNLNMLSQMIAAYSNAGQQYQDSGTANAYVLSIASNLKAVHKYFDGMKVTFKAGNSNTGVSTVNIETIGTKPITSLDGSALKAGDLVSGFYCTLIYNISDDRFELVKFSAFKAVDFETKDLIINFQSNTTVDMDAAFVSLLDNSFIPKYLDNVNKTFTMPTDLEAGTSEKVSHWYGMWMDVNGVLKLVPDLTGSADSIGSNQLKDSTATFLTDLVHFGDIVYNLKDKTKATATADASAEGIVSLSADIFPSGNEAYKIVKMSPLGLVENRERFGSVYNNSSGNFDDSAYTQLQERKPYFGDTTGNLDFIITAVPAITVLIRAIIIPYQVNDFSGTPMWRQKFNCRYTVASAARSQSDMSLSGTILKTTAALTQSISGSARTSSNWYAAADSAGNFYRAQHSSIATTQYEFSGDVEVDKKQTFAK